MTRVEPIVLCADSLALEGRIASWQFVRARLGLRYLFGKSRLRGIAHRPQRSTVVLITRLRAYCLRISKRRACRASQLLYIPSCKQLPMRQSPGAIQPSARHCYAVSWVLRHPHLLDKTRPGGVDLVRMVCLGMAWAEEAGVQLQPGVCRGHASTAPAGPQPQVLWRTGYDSFPGPGQLFMPHTWTYPAKSTLPA